MLDSIIWAFKHTMRNVADTGKQTARWNRAACWRLAVLTVLLCSCPSGLQILYTLLQNVAQEEAAAQSFYQTYFCDILQHIFSVVTDTSHTAGEFTHTHRKR